MNSEGRVQLDGTMAHTPPTAPSHLSRAPMRAAAPRPLESAARMDVSPASEAAVEGEGRNDEDEDAPSEEPPGPRDARIVARRVAVFCSAFSKDAKRALIAAGSMKRVIALVARRIAQERQTGRDEQSRALATGKEWGGSCWRSVDDDEG